IVYNDALTSKSDFSTELTLCPQHIDEFNLKDETSLSEYDEVEQNVLYFNDVFLVNIIYPDDINSNKDNDDNEINMIQSFGGNENTQGSNNLLEGSQNKIYKVFIMKSFVMELNVNIVAWNYLVNGMLFNLIKILYVPFGISFNPKWYYKDGDCTRMLRRPRYQGLEYSGRDIANLEERFERIHDKGIHRVQVLDFDGMLELIRDVLYARTLMEHRDDDRVVVTLVRHGVEYLRLVEHWRSHEMYELEGVHLSSRITYMGGDRVLRMMAHSIAGRSQAPEKVTVTDLFYLRGLDVGSVNILYLLGRYLRRFAIGRKSRALILGRSVAPRGGDEDEEMSQAMPPPPRTQGKRITRLEEEVHGMRKVIQGQREVPHSMARDFSRFTMWTVTSLSQMMDRTGVIYTRYSESSVKYQRCSVRQRTDDANTFAAPQQPDP
nr:hypothetical protein [Tanacetum cinerariifolium]